VKININDMITVTVKEKGREILQARRDELEAHIGRELPDKKPITVGPLRDQLWRVMMIFGPYVGNGFELPIETDIEVGGKLEEELAKVKAELEFERASRFALMQGVLDGARPGTDLGESAKARGFTSRTPKGDSYESGFLWAKKERE